MLLTSFTKAAASSFSKSSRERRHLNEAAGVLDAARNLSEHPLTSASSARGLASTGAVLDLAESIEGKESPDRALEILSKVAAVLRSAARGDEVGQVAPVRPEVSRLPDEREELLRLRSLEGKLRSRLGDPNAG